ncbi:MAG: Maf family protein [Syntrophomonas sp.]
MKNIILASQSPRRRMLLNMLGLDFVSIAADTEEDFLPGEGALQAARRIARQKALLVGSSLREGIVIAADTVVCCEGELMGKPLDDEDAFIKLSRLSGRSHQVITAVCLVDAATQEEETISEITKVYFRTLSPQEIEAYIATGEAKDKAGAYGIQGRAAVFAEKIEGCYYNVVGLPLSSLYLLLKKHGLDLWGGHWSQA